LSVSTVSYATHAAPLSASARVSSSLAARWRYVKRTSPSCSRVLLGQRLLDLEQELGVAPDVVDRVNRRADAAICVVGERAAVAGPGLDEHVVPALDELARTGRRERDAVLVGLDLFDDADLHRGEKP